MKGGQAHLYWPKNSKAELKSQVHPEKHFFKNLDLNVSHLWKAPRDTWHLSLILVSLARQRHLIQNWCREMHLARQTSALVSLEIRTPLFGDKVKVTRCDVESDLNKSFVCISFFLASKRIEKRGWTDQHLEQRRFLQADDSTLTNLATMFCELCGK